MNVGTLACVHPPDGYCKASDYEKSSSGGCMGDLQPGEMVIFFGDSTYTNRRISMRMARVLSRFGVGWVFYDDLREVSCGYG